MPPHSALELPEAENTKMQEYRAYLVDPEGHIVGRTDLVCADDATAKEQAQQLVDGHDVELWQGAKKLAIFKHS